MRLGTSAHSTYISFGVEVDANAADVPGKVHTTYECCRSRLQLLIVIRCIHTGYLLFLIRHSID